MRFLAVAGLLLGLFAAPAAFAQGPDAAARLTAQREAMKAFDMLDGEWRGPGQTLKGDGSWLQLTQTERVGPMLDGTVKVLEGRGYMEDGSLGFNAFAVISYDPDTKAYSMRSYQGGRAGDFPIKPTPTGFTWEIQAGPAMKIYYEAKVEDGAWIETGTRIPTTGDAIKFIEFAVMRQGNSTWPAAGAMQPH